MGGLQVLMLIGGAWFALVLAFRWLILPVLRSGPDGSARLGAVWFLARALCAVVHHQQTRGEATRRDDRDLGPLVVVSNHTGAIDPFLIQSACRFAIRWMMAVEQMVPALDWMWTLLQVIPVARDGRDAAAVRQAMRILRDGRALGIFPEGRIVTPAKQIWPFLAGVGLIIARTRAPVMLVWVSGTPPKNSLIGSLLTPSHARVVFTEPIEYGEDDDAESITEDLRRRMHELSGWPLNDDPPPPKPRADALEPAASGSMSA